MNKPDAIQIDCKTNKKTLVYKVNENHTFTAPEVRVRSVLIDKTSHKDNKPITFEDEEEK